MNWYVSETGSDSNDGQINPFLTLQKALDVCNDLDTINCSGTYSGTITKNITLIGNFNNLTIQSNVTITNSTISNILVEDYNITNINNSDINTIKLNGQFSLTYNTISGIIDIVNTRDTCNISNNTFTSGINFNNDNNINTKKTGIINITNNIATLISDTFIYFYEFNNYPPSNLNDYLILNITNNTINSTNPNKFIEIKLNNANDLKMFSKVLINNNTINNTNHGVLHLSKYVNNTAIVIPNVSLFKIYENIVSTKYPTLSYVVNAENIVGTTSSVTALEEKNKDVNKRIILNSPGTFTSPDQLYKPTSVVMEVAGLRQLGAQTFIIEYTRPSTTSSIVLATRHLTSTYPQIGLYTDFFMYWPDSRGPKTFAHLSDELANTRTIIALSYDFTVENHEVTIMTKNYISKYIKNISATRINLQTNEVTDITQNPFTNSELMSSGNSGDNNQITLLSRNNTDSREFTLHKFDYYDRCLSIEELRTYNM